MISKILVPTDFSEVANNALKYAIGLAMQTEASLYVLHVKSFPVMDTAFPSDIYATLLDEMETLAKNGFEKLKTAYLEPSGVNYEFHSVSGFINDEIANTSSSQAIDLIIMGTTGASGLQELLVGSNAATTVARSEIPVFVIPPTANYNEIKHILYASDYTEPEFPALSKLMYFAELSQASIAVLHVKTDYDHYFNSSQNFFVKNKKQINKENIQVIQSDKAEIQEAINDYIDKNPTDLLVLAKHNRSFFDKLFHRSLSKQMAYHTKIPLLVLNK